MVIITRPRDVSDPFYRPQAQDYSHAYTSILAASRRAAAASTSLASSGDLTGSSTVLILSALDVDALCATKSLVSLFTEDEIAYRVVPVDGYSTLDAVIREDVVDNLDVSNLRPDHLGERIADILTDGTHSLGRHIAAHGHLCEPRLLTLHAELLYHVIQSRP